MSGRHGGCKHHSPVLSWSRSTTPGSQSRLLHGACRTRSMSRGPGEMYIGGPGRGSLFSFFLAEVQNAAGLIECVRFVPPDSSIQSTRPNIRRYPDFPKGDKSKMAARLRRLARPRRNLKHAGRGRPSFARLSLDDQRGREKDHSGPRLSLWQRARSGRGAGDHEACMSTQGVHEFAYTGGQGRMYLGGTSN